tara:strand:+ start:199 stop:396 length:198 start_codon:yes stop_codon:yes gene_type:complete
VTAIPVDYFFEQQQRVKLEIYDVDEAKDLLNLSGHDFVGTAEFVLGKVVTSMNQETTEPLLQGPG